MHATSWARQALPAVVLEPGLALDEVRKHLGTGLRLGDVGQRILAFYFVEMEERGLHQASGHSSTAQFAEDELDLDRRRTGELLRLGRKLLDLPRIDAAFCAGRIGWSKVLLLMRVVVPEHEQAWLARALALSCRDLALEVKLSKEGAAPRKPGDHKGLPEVRFRVSASLDVLGWQMVELAKQKLSAELGRPVGDAELLQEAAELLLQMEEDGSVPGRKRVDASLFRIVLRGSDENLDENLVADTELGPMPIDGGEDDDVLSRVRSDCVRCDGESVGEAGDERQRDVPTPPALRRRVLARDGGRCRCCGSRRRLMVHHIRYRSKGGRTKAANLISLCVSCHSLVHAGLLVLRGRHAARVQFLDADGRRLGGPRKRVSAARLAALIEVQPPAQSAERSAPEELTPARPTPQEAAVAFRGIVGQRDLLARLNLAARGSLARGCSFPHTLFAGPPGTGKTTLARAIAARCGARLTETAGPLLQDVPALLTLLRGLEAGDMLFLDEVHAVPRPVLETLYQAMAERRVGALELPAFTVLAATTEDGELPQALRSRFGLLEDLGYYPLEDLAALASRAAAEQGVPAERSAALHLAASARGTPREALRLLERVLDHVVTSGERASGAKSIDRAAVDATLTQLGYDDDGLRPVEQRYLAVLRECRSPVPLQRLARMLGASARTLIEHLEPDLFRRGLVGMTARGRIALPCPQPARA